MPLYTGYGDAERGSLIMTKYLLESSVPPQRPNVQINAQSQLSIKNILVWEIEHGAETIYKISIPGLSQEDYHARVMIRGKQAEQHVLKQYEEKGATYTEYPIIYCLSDSEQEEYLQLLNGNRIRECIEYLRRVEDTLNSKTKDTTHKTKKRVNKEQI